MNLKNLSTIIKNSNPKRSIMLRGVQGLGKTQWCRQLANELGLKFVIWHASHAADAGDITGLPKQVKETAVWYDEIGVEHRDVYDVTIMCPPKWMIHHEPVLLLLDEFNRGMEITLNALMQLTCGQSYDDVSLPEGSRIIACINPDSDGTYDVTKLDPAQRSRFDIYDFTPSVDDWLDWARSNGVNKTVIDFIAAYPRFLDPYTNEELMHTVSGQDCIKLPDRRAWAEAVSYFIDSGEKQKLWDTSDGLDLMHEGIAGMIGLGAADVFMSFYINSMKQLNPYKIIAMEKIPQDIHSKLADAIKKDMSVGVGFIKSCTMFIEDNVDKVMKKTAESKIWCDNLYELVDRLPPECRVAVGIDILFSAVEQKKQWAKAVMLMKPEFKELIRSVKIVETDMR